MSKYTQKTLKHLREEGWKPWVVERWVGRTLGSEEVEGRWGSRVDLYNLVDLVAVRGPVTMGVQSTGPNGHAAHRKEMLGNHHLGMLVGAGWRIVLISWHKRVLKRGGKAWRWRPRIEDIGGLWARERLLS